VRQAESIAVLFVPSRLRTSRECRGKKLLPPDTEPSVDLALAALVDSVVLGLAQVSFADIASLVHIVAVVVAVIGVHDDAFPGERG